MSPLRDGERGERIWSVSWANDVLYLTLGERDGELMLLLVAGFPAEGVRRLVEWCKVTTVDEIARPELEAIVTGSGAEMKLCGFRGLVPK